MTDKLKTFLRVVAHTLLSFIAAIFAGLMLEAFVKILVPRRRELETFNSWGVPRAC